jgi:hypothetical protein
MAIEDPQAERANGERQPELQVVRRATVVSKESRMKLTSISIANQERGLARPLSPSALTAGRIRELQEGGDPTLAEVLAAYKLAIAERDAMKAELDRQVFERWRAHEVLDHALAERNRLMGENVALRTALESTQRLVRTRTIRIRRERLDDDN